jgi:hypothetical protein
LKKTRSPTLTIKSSWEPGAIDADSGLVSVIVPSSLEETSDDEEEEPDPDESAVSFGVVEQAAKKNTKSALVNNFIII